MTHGDDAGHEGQSTAGGDGPAGEDDVFPLIFVRPVTVLKTVQFPLTLGGFVPELTLDDAVLLPVTF